MTTKAERPIVMRLGSCSKEKILGTKKPPRHRRGGFYLSKIYYSATNSKSSMNLVV